MRLKVDFVDFWGGFNKTNNYFFNILKDMYDIEISNNPDILFYSLFGTTHKQYNCTKIFFTGENIAPPNDCNWSFSFEVNDDKNYRLPLYLLYDGYYDLVNKQITDDLTNRKFCNFVVSNGASPERNDFFIKLSKYKKVDSGGRFMNNIGYYLEDKRKFQSEYKFSIAFENTEYRNNNGYYITEKIMEPMTVNSIPIYKGGHFINEDFNTKSFINCHNFQSIDDVIDYIIEVDKNDHMYMSMLNEPWFNNNEIPVNFRLESIEKQLGKIIESI